MKKNKKNIIYVNLWGYIQHRMTFLNRCSRKEVRARDYYKRPNRILYCKVFRAILIRFGNKWDRKELVYESSFCKFKTCLWKGTCDKCKFNLNNYLL